ncbi:MAG: hypothetical protein AB1726_15135, partial [Planctomycetota bacterium]
MARRDRGLDEDRRRPGVRAGRGGCRRLVGGEDLGGQLGRELVRGARRNRRDGAGVGGRALAGRRLGGLPARAAAVRDLPPVVGPAALVLAAALFLAPARVLPAALLGEVRRFRAGIGGFQGDGPEAAGGGGRLRPARPGRRGL